MYRPEDLTKPFVDMLESAANYLKRKKIPCKTPREIELQYRTYTTRRNNLSKRWYNMDIKTGTNAEQIQGQMFTLDIKIKLLKNILKLDK